jgi:hypothetical protein
MDPIISTFPLLNPTQLATNRTDRYRRQQHSMRNHSLQEAGIMSSLFSSNVYGLNQVIPPLSHLHQGVYI